MSQHFCLRVVNPVPVKRFHFGFLCDRKWSCLTVLAPPSCLHSAPTGEFIATPTHIVVNDCRSILDVNGTACLTNTRRKTGSSSETRNCHNKKQVLNDA